MVRNRAEAPTAGTGVTRYVVGALVLGVLAVVLAVQNSERAEVDLLVWSGRAPLYALAFIAALVGAAATASVTALWRRRRILRNRERRAVDPRAPRSAPHHEEPAPWPHSPPSP